MFTPIPFYWALSEMKGSRFVLTATNMNGWVADSFRIKPDQLQLINPIFILLLLPLFQKVLIKRRVIGNNLLPF